MHTQQEIQSKLKTIKPYLMEKYDIKSVGYFGSYARNEQNADSDLDVLIELNEGLGWSFFDIQMELEEFFNLKIDLVTKKALKKQLRKQILEDIVLV